MLFKNAGSSSVNDCGKKTATFEETPIHFVTHSDDIRSGKLQYTIIDNNSVKQILKNLNVSSCNGRESFTNLALLSHIRLPEVNEIVCVDDLNLNSHMLTSQVASSFGSHVSWRYPKRRALVELKIFPLPLVSADNLASGELTCFLEYFNECVKKFVVLKQFVIKEGVQTNLIERQKSVEFGRGLIFARCWRIRLSNEAKRYIYASSLLASTKVDSVELQTNESSCLLYTQLELNVSNIDCKLNSSSLADLFCINLSDFGLRLNLTELPSTHLKKVGRANCLLFRISDCVTFGGKYLFFVYTYLWLRN